MWNAIGQAIKIFVDKYLVQTIISVVIAIASFLVLPPNFWMIKRIGKISFAILVAGIVFLILLLIVNIFKKKNAHKSKIRNKELESIEKDQLEKIWTFVDKLNQNEYDILINFIRTKNQPMQITGQFFGESLFNSNAIISSKIGITLTENNDISIEQAIAINSMYDNSNMYRLNDKFFNNLLYSIIKYNRICHFAEIPEELKKEILNNNYSKKEA